MRVQRVHLISVENADKLVARDLDTTWIDLRAAVVNIPRLAIHFTSLPLAARHIHDLHTACLASRATLAVAQFLSRMIKLDSIYAGQLDTQATSPSDAQSKCTSMISGYRISGHLIAESLAKFALFRVLAVVAEVDGALASIWQHRIIRRHNSPPHNRNVLCRQAGNTELCEGVCIELIRYSHA